MLLSLLLLLLNPPTPQDAINILIISSCSAELDEELRVEADNFLHYCDSLYLLAIKTGKLDSMERQGDKRVEAFKNINLENMLSTEFSIILELNCSNYFSDISIEIIECHSKDVDLTLYNFIIEIDQLKYLQEGDLYMLEAHLKTTNFFNGGQVSFDDKLTIKSDFNGFEQELGNIGVNIIHSLNMAFTNKIVYTIL